jgi:hypothetical protein
MKEFSMDIKILLRCESRLGAPSIRCTVDEGAPFFDGDAVEQITATIGTAPGFHELVISHYNKQDHDHQLDEYGNILIDKHVEIIGISIDDIAFSIDELREAHFYPVYNPVYYQQQLDQNNRLPPSITPNLYLGHNGIWKLSFHTPFVEYIIQKRKNLALHLDNTIFQSDIELLQQTKAWILAQPDITWNI